MQTEIGIPLVFFYLLGIAAIVAAAGFAVPRIMKAYGELPEPKPDPIMERLYKSCYPLPEDYNKVGPGQGGTAGLREGFFGESDATGGT